MRRRIHKWIVLFAVITGVLCMPVICHAEGSTGKSDRLAGEDEKAASKPVGEEGMIPVYGEDIKDGIYSIEAESSSPMFRIVKAVLTADHGSMTAVITLSGKGYLGVYMGTGEQAVEAEEAEYIAYEEDEEGAYTYTIPVEALNQELECTAFSKKKEKWYDRQILFRADTLPRGAFLKIPAPARIDVQDGNYTMEVSLAGGSGRAKILSPAPVTVSDGTAAAAIRWSSPDYDYMIVNGEKYLPINTEGDSVFEIPVWILDQELAVTAETTAMSTPHEIAYTLIFHSDTLKSSSGNRWIICVTVLLAAGAAGGICFIISKKKKVRHE